jgi:hypothetical protein
LIPLTIIQVSFLFSRDDSSENYWLIPISLFVGFLDCCFGLNSWFDYGLINKNIKSYLIKNRYNLNEQKKIYLILILTLGTSFSVGFASKYNNSRFSFIYGDN